MAVTHKVNVGGSSCPVLGLSLDYLTMWQRVSTHHRFLENDFYNLFREYPEPSPYIQILLSLKELLLSWPLLSLRTLFLSGIQEVERSV